MALGRNGESINGTGMAERLSALGATLEAITARIDAIEENVDERDKENKESLHNLRGNLQKMQEIIYNLELKFAPPLAMIPEMQETLRQVRDAQVGQAAVGKSRDEAQSKRDGMTQRRILYAAIASAVIMLVGIIADKGCSHKIATILDSDNHQPVLASDPGRPANQ